MSEHKDFPLVQGTFEIEDAKEILLGLIEHKIKFHNRKLHGHAERHGETDLHSKERVKILRETRQRLISDLDAHQGQTVTIHSDISIEYRAKKSV